MNPGDSDCRKGEQEQAMRGMWLVRVSILFAIVLEMTLVEANAISLFLLADAVLLVLAMKLTCLTLIILPLVIYVALNGLKGLRCVKGRVAVVAVIVAINLALNTVMLLAWARQ